MDDPYAKAQFGSLWKVVVHATADTEDRLAVYRDAWAAMVRDRRWRSYRMIFSPVKGFHVGYAYANPRDWYVLNETTDEVEGPFGSKKMCLRVAREKRGRKVQPGVYAAGDYLIFTRANAEDVGLTGEVLP